MPANSSIVLTNLDFDQNRNTLKQYLRAQERFKDYDFEGSNMAVLLDILSYNTYNNNFYLNMVGTEMFLDTALQRDSVVSHAKDLNYTPRSFKSATATVSISVRSNDLNKRSVTIPKGTSFTSKYGTTSYTFTIGENIVVTDYSLSGNQIVFSKDNIQLHEGYYIADSFSVNYSNKSRYLLSNPTVDTSSINVTVIEDSGDSVQTYFQSESLFGLDENSKIFFLQGAENETYELIFGDGVIGRKPKDNSVVVVEYRVCNGELPNGANQFTADGSIDGETDITVTTTQKAQGGFVRETTDSIKFNAPRHFATQERAITPEDFQFLLKNEFPEINAVIAYGGEDLNPPKYGKVFIAVDLAEYDLTPEYKKEEYLNFIKPRASVNITPVIVDPDYTYIYVETVIDYDVGKTNLTPEDIKTIVTSAVLNYSDTNLNNFGRKFRYSNFTKAIDDSQVSILSNDTHIRLVKEFIPDLGRTLKTTIDFGVPLATIANEIYNSNKFTSKALVTSSVFTFNGAVVQLQDDANGFMNMVSYSTQAAVIKKVGTVDYATGVVNLTDLNIDSFEGDAIKLIAIPQESDVMLNNKNIILSIRREDLSLEVSGTTA